MGFSFDAVKTVEICGNEYECDPGNPDIVLGASRDFQKIIGLSHELKALTTPKKDDENADAAALALTQEAIDKNMELLKACRGMIEGCLGEKEYVQIFSSRRPNSTEHLKLCTYLFRYLTEGRDKLVEKYLDLPEVKEDADGDPASGNTGEEDRDGLPQMDKILPDAGCAAASDGEVHPCPAEHPGGDTEG